ncbi:TRAP transporter permease [Tepidiphilus olei]|uniref:TRAP transporter permease n=1 Tax=Tepidiphilus olei TaxID=2502184 RepID=UPI00115E8556|nr:TRAP transporter fused permease subunit [Tepidiphilus olei]
MERFRERIINAEIYKSGRLSGLSFWWVFFVTIFGLLLTINQVFNLRFAGFQLISTAYYYLMIGIFGGLVFLFFPARKNQDRPQIYDWLMTFVWFFCSVWISIKAQYIIDRGWNQGAPIEAVVIATIYVALSLEALRRTGGKFLFIFCLLFATFPLYAGKMPGFLWGVELTFSQTVSEHVFGMEGIIGVPMQVVCDTLIGFLVFGVVLAGTGGGAFFMDFANSLMGSRRGGPAKVAIVSSGLFGSLSGSPTSNVMTTGSLTIPAMIRCGYSPTYAAAVEACASTGGTIMPPVMGTAAFIMASFLNVPYSHVVVSAFIPAVFYYVFLILQTDCYAARKGLRGLPTEELPSLRTTLLGGWYYLVALIILTFMLLMMPAQNEVPYWVSLFLIVIALFRRHSLRFDMRRFVTLVVEIGQSIAQIVGLIAGIGLIIGSMSITGVANSFSRELVQIAGDNLWLLLLVGAFTSFVLGIGMTASACYIFLAIVLAPALVQIGIDPMAAHLYIFYWGMVSFITPPVALAAIAASTIAKANPIVTGFYALRVGSLLFLLPVIFILEPALLLRGSWSALIQAVLTTTLAVFLLSAAVEGFFWRVGLLGYVSRLILGISGLCFLVPGWKTDIIAIFLFVLFLIGGFLRINGKSIYKSG